MVQKSQENSKYEYEDIKNESNLKYIIRMKTQFALKQKSKYSVKHLFKRYGYHGVFESHFERVAKLHNCLSEERLKAPGALVPSHRTK